MSKKEKLLLLSCCAPCSVGVISDLKEKGIDFTVLFDRNAFALVDYADNYFDFKFALEDLFKRNVDLVEYNAIRNPYFKEEVDATKKLIYGQTS